MGFPGRLRGFGRCCAALLAWLLGLVALPAIGPELPTPDGEVIVILPAGLDELPAQRRAELAAHPSQAPPAVLEAAASSFSQPVAVIVATYVYDGTRVPIQGYVGTSDPINRYDPSGLDDVVAGADGIAFWRTDSGKDIPIGVFNRTGIGDFGTDIKIFDNFRTKHTLNINSVNELVGFSFFDDVGVGAGSFSLFTAKRLAENIHLDQIDRDLWETTIKLAFDGENNPSVVNSADHTIKLQEQFLQLSSDLREERKNKGSPPSNRQNRLINIRSQEGLHLKVRDETLRFVGASKVTGEIAQEVVGAGLEILPIGDAIAIIRDPTDPLNFVGIVPIAGDAVKVVNRTARTDQLVRTAPGGSGPNRNRKLNIFGEGEARPGFEDVSTNKRHARGRPLTEDIPSGSAKEIFIRNSPVNGDNTLEEIKRLSRPGTRVTLLQPFDGFQGNELLEGLGEGAEVVLDRTFTSNRFFNPVTGDPEILRQIQVIIE